MAHYGSGQARYMQPRDRVIEEERVTATPYREDVAIGRVQRLIYTLVGILDALLILRVLLSLVAANAANPIAHFVYSVTAPFIAPFRGLLNIHPHVGVVRFEFETIIAIVAYSLIAWGAIHLLSVGKHDPNIDV